MVKLTAKELERQGTFYSEKFQKSQVMFQEKTYTRGPDFSKNLHAKAIRFCQKYDKLNLETLIVEHPLYLAIWIQNTRVMAIAERAS
ncbi:MAG: hypothetical protein ACRC2R_15785 [Xenococcaceae cyanobacterium]